MVFRLYSEQKLPFLMSAKKTTEVTEEATFSMEKVELSPEVVHSTPAPTAVLLSPEKPVVNYHITSPDETKHLANDLARFIRENKLFHNIQGKEYVNVEGWQYAGSRLGILPIVEELDRIVGIDEAEIKYQAKVKLFDLQTSQVVGTGFAICSNKESSKKFYQEFAIASMAQTRAIGKAYRNILAWIIRAAGYEPTPAEEMEYLPTGPANLPATSPAAQQPVRPLHEASPKDKLTEAPLPAVAPASEAPAVDPAFKPVTINQKTQILLLLNNSVITKEEKERMVAKLNTLDNERAEQAINKLKKVIRERGNTSGMAA